MTLVEYFLIFLKGIPSIAYPIAGIVSLWAIVTVNLFILAETAHALMKRGLWFIAAAVSIFSMIIGMVWCVIPRLEGLVAFLFLLFCLISPIVKFLRAWRQDRMPKHFLYALVLKIAAPAWCLMLVCLSVQAVGEYQRRTESEITGGWVHL